MFWKKFKVIFSEIKKIMSFVDEIREKISVLEDKVESMEKTHPNKRLYKNTLKSVKKAVK